jgi:ATP-dependent helicase Lhr and Lhr-like helicase
MRQAAFHPAIARWFQERFGSPSEPQLRGWPAIQSGRDVLIAAPTGSGKTLAAFLAALDELFREGLAAEQRTGRPILPDETRVLYVSPLKALSNDIHQNLEEPLAGIREALAAEGLPRIEVRAEVRTGDTPPSKRQAIARKPPHILVTTPESLYLLLTSESGRRVLRTVRSVIVDEIHAVVGNRRGCHLALSLERLASLVKRPLQRIGLSATQNPIKEVACFLVGARGAAAAGEARCTIVDCSFSRQMDLGIELPGAPLEAVMSNEVWSEVYNRLATLIREHRTTLVFVNTRRLAERVTHHLGERLGKEQVTSHHGSLAARLRLEAEGRLKRGELKALVATSSLELGIDIGSVDLVCQLGPTRSIGTLLQRVGRACHQRGGVPKGRIFPLTRDELVECAAMLRSVERGELDRLHIPEKPLDVLAQQIVACAATEDWDESDLFALLRLAYPYRELRAEQFAEVLRMLAEGFSTKRGRRGALIHRDEVNHRLRGRRGARLVALTSGGAIPDNSDYRVVVEPSEIFVGTVNEDFAVESQAGDIFQLGNASWRILRLNSGTVRVEDAQGQPPSIPFWLGEAPGRTDELSGAVSRFRDEAQDRIQEGDLEAWLCRNFSLPKLGASQLAEYFTAAYRALGAIPSQRRIVLERFFDESGGMQLVIHAPFGIRLNRAWGLALRKRFCRSFNFELQAAATDDAIILSLGTQHSFPLDEVFRYLNSRTVRDLLVQALLDAPMFPIRWRWNATRALALPRQRGGRKIPAPLQRMESENLLASVFPDQLACLENIAGDRAIPKHPLVQQTIDDCLSEAMDVSGLIRLLKQIERGQIQCIARDVPEPSPLAHEILHARPYAFLDNAPLEERRTQAVYTRRSGSFGGNGQGILDAAAIDKVCVEAWPRATNPDELHDALLMAGALKPEELALVAPDAGRWIQQLASQKRAGLLSGPVSFWVAAERLQMIRAIYPEPAIHPTLTPPLSHLSQDWDRADAARELVRGRLEVSGPMTSRSLADLFRLPLTAVDAALAALEAEGFLLRGKFRPAATDQEWCDRRLLARIHRLTINRLRAEIQPVSMAEFQRFLFAWQKAGPEYAMEGPEGVAAVLNLLDGFEIPAGAWEPEILALRVASYEPKWLDQLCYTGRVGWGRFSPPQTQTGRPCAPIRSSPISIFARQNLVHWLALAGNSSGAGFAPDTEAVLQKLLNAGALFFGELARETRLLPSRVEQALAELTAQGWATSDSFEGLRALLTPPEKRVPMADLHRKRHHRAVTSVAYAGRWALLRKPGLDPTREPKSDTSVARDEAIEVFARALLARYGAVFRRLLDRETLQVSWYEVARVLRRLEAIGEIRGGYFVAGVSGEQFALPEAIGLMRSLRKDELRNELVTISAADPLNLTGILAPGPRVSAIQPNRVLFLNGVAMASLEAGRVEHLHPEARQMNGVMERALRVGSLPACLRPYYAR